MKCFCPFECIPDSPDCKTDHLKNSFLGGHRKVAPLSLFLIVFANATAAWFCTNVQNIFLFFFFVDRGQSHMCVLGFLQKRLVKYYLLNALMHGFDLQFCLLIKKNSFRVLCVNECYCCFGCQTCSLDGLGGWNSSGCETQKTSSYQTSCLCNHLTHFAILMVSFLRDLGFKAGSNCPLNDLIVIV